MASNSKRLDVRALAAEVLAADARFNLGVSQTKGKGTSVDLLELVDCYEEVVESCIRALDAFDSDADATRLCENLKVVRDDLRRRAAEMGQEV